jgi:hypothetical protein
MLIALPSIGWYTAGGAERLARMRAEQAVVAALAPVCANIFLAQPDAKAKMAALEKADSWDKRKLVSLPGQTEVDRDVANACAALVLKSKGA